ncbi:hypothetical protein ISG08_07210 [Burkholderia pseudomallei]|uniref:hypothetical protein n=1 Tax=Burkholderia pseudomallei TaxID=28450 RepID=UPI0006AD820F|nr:hypothetical protein [Burkholderia pseudomallei]ALB92989.1 hypothetical protein AM256_04760 [Burkholderia pseudomallei]ARL51347.1 hypothetical protein BOC51_16350 [Burkholderia pseudomallei]MBF3412360.1 hypothetical protein [Burkholderia pseudomallei]MBF3575718.1 hypothetical protein [Burkholderia pseudomallei]MBF3601620.1 hypothetical protein [Burkholderia pseudomallei]
MKCQELARLNVPIRYATHHGDDHVSRNISDLDFDVDTLLFIRSYTDPETGRMIRCLSDIDAAPGT